MWFQKNKWKIIVPVLIVTVLAAAFFFEDNAPKTEKQPEIVQTPAEVESPAVPESPPKETTPEEVPVSDIPESPAIAESVPTEKPAEAGPEESPEPSAELVAETGQEPEKDVYLTEPVPDGKPDPVEPQEAEVTETVYTCTISISCATILDNMELCNPDKRELVPANGWILGPTEVTFYEGESVFNVLQRVCKQKKIHMEFENTPIYNSAYIEGIYNLYEFDVGELSGWMYKVNGWFPNYGCSRYQLEDGDVICWVYTCDLGYDVGGGYATGG